MGKTDKYFLWTLFIVTMILMSLNYAIQLFKQVVVIYHALGLAVTSAIVVFSVVIDVVVLALIMALGIRIYVKVSERIK